VAILDDNLINSIEEDIRLGNIESAKKTLSSLSRTKIPRKFILRMANFSRRIGNHRWSVHLLNPVVRPKELHKVAPSVEEWTEYAICLTRLGASQEAIEILLNLKALDRPEVKLNLAFAHMVDWDYDPAIKLPEQ